MAIFVTTTENYDVMRIKMMQPFLTWRAYGEDVSFPMAKAPGFFLGRFRGYV